MKKVPNEDYIYRRGEVYWFSRRVEATSVPELGQFYRKSLKTSDLKIARKRRDVVLAEYRRAAAQAEGDTSDDYIIAQAKALRDHVTREGLSTDHAVFDYLDNLLEKYMATDPKASLEKARVASKIATSFSKTVYESIDDYLAEIKPELVPQTVEEKRRHLAAYKSYLKSDRPLADVLTPEHGYDYLTDYILQQELATPTKRKYLKNVEAFFDWCRDRGRARMNPFQGLKVKVVKGRKGKQRNRRAWTDEEMKTLFDGLLHDAKHGHDKRARSNSKRLIPMAIIAAYTGMRIDEIAELRAEDVTEAGLLIREGKTEAALRTVPINSELRKLVDELAEKAVEGDGYLIPDLIRGGDNKKRSWHIQKAFGRKKTALGFDSKLVFHSFRYALITKLKRAGVPAILLKETIGHAVDDISFGHYGEDMLIRDKQDAIERVKYDFDLLAYAAAVA